MNKEALKLKVEFQEEQKKKLNIRKGQNPLRRKENQTKNGKGNWHIWKKNKKKGNSKLKGPEAPPKNNLNGYKLSCIANGTLTSTLLY